MKRVNLFLATLFFGFVYSLSYATERIGAAGDTVDISRLNGFSRWLGMLYNEHRIIYALTSVVVVVAIGVVLGLSMEFILARIGSEKRKV